MKISQAPKITSAFLKSMCQGYEGHLEIHLHMEANGNIEAVGETPRKPVVEEQNRREALDIIALIGSFPQPRLQNFLKYVFAESVKKMGRRTEVARWLGVDRRTITRKVRMKSVPMEESEVEIRQIHP